MGGYASKDTTHRCDCQCSSCYGKYIHLDDCACKYCMHYKRVPRIIWCWSSYVEPEHTAGCVCVYCITFHCRERERPKHKDNCDCKYCKNGLKIPHKLFCRCFACMYGVYR